MYAICGLIALVFALTLWITVANYLREGICDIAGRLAHTPGMFLPDWFRVTAFFAANGLMLGILAVYGMVALHDYFAYLR